MVMSSEEFNKLMRCRIAIITLLENKLFLEHSDDEQTTLNLMLKSIEETIELVAKHSICIN